MSVRPFVTQQENKLTHGLNDFPLKGRGTISGLVSCRVSEEGAYFCSKASPSSGRRQGDLLESTLHAQLDQAWTQPLDHQGVLLLIRLLKVTPHPTYEPHYQAREMAPGQSARWGSSRTGHANALREEDRREFLEGKRRMIKGLRLTQGG